MKATTCGLWSARNRLVAVVVDNDGAADSALTIPRTREAYWALLSHIDATVGPDCELVLPTWIARADGIARVALARGTPIWLVPDELATAVRIIGQLGTGPPRRTAAALARLPLAPALRPHLRRLRPGDRRQLPLL